MIRTLREPDADTDDFVGACDGDLCTEVDVAPIRAREAAVGAIKCDEDDEDEGATVRFVVKGAVEVEEDRPPFGGVEADVDVGRGGSFALALASEAAVGAKSPLDEPDAGTLGRDVIDVVRTRVEEGVLERPPGVEVELNDAGIGGGGGTTACRREIDAEVELVPVCWGLRTGATGGCGEALDFWVGMIVDEEEGVGEGPFLRCGVDLARCRDLDEVDALRDD